MTLDALSRLLLFGLVPAALVLGILIGIYHCL
jgi:hypothetical protein